MGPISSSVTLHQAKKASQEQNTLADSEHS